MKKPNENDNLKNATSMHVAKLAGVSQSTVSRVFSKDPRLTEETCRKVLEAAEQLGYRPNAIAKSLLTQRTYIIGLVMTDFGDHYYTSVLKSFSRHLQKIGLQIMLFNYNAMEGASDGIDSILDRVLRYRVDALIITSTKITGSMVNQFSRYSIPVVLFNRSMPDAGISAVCCDYIEAGGVVAEFLLENGHKRFGFSAGALNNYTSVTRLNGFRERLNEKGITDLQVEEGDYTYESGCKVAREMLNGKTRREAIFFGNDIMALGAVDVARYELGLKIPEDVSIVGFDDIPAASLPGYMVTTYRQPIEAMVESSVDLLEKLLADEKREPELRLLKGELIIRKSARIMST